MNRRDLLVSAATVAAAGTLAGTRAYAQAGAAPAGTATASLANALAACIEASNACLQHCLDVLATGDKSLGDCAKSVHQLLAICNATGVLVAGDAPLRARQVALCLEACAQCEKACEPHVAHHEVCRRCRDACRATIAAASSAA